eukprot:349883-Chlamydomonas_euryale.AAC.4
MLKCPAIVPPINQYGYARNEVEGWQRVQMSVRPFLKRGVHTRVLEAWGSYAISRFAVARGAP